MDDDGDYEGSDSTDTDRNYREFAHILDYRYYDTPEYSDATSVFEDAMSPENEDQNSGGNNANTNSETANNGDADHAHGEANNNGNSIDKELLIMALMPVSARSGKRLRCPTDSQEEDVDRKFEGVVSKTKRKANCDSNAGDSWSPTEVQKSKSSSKVDCTVPVPVSPRGNNELLEENANDGRERSYDDNVMLGGIEIPRYSATNIKGGEHTLKLPSLLHKCQHLVSNTNTDKQRSKKGQKSKVKSGSNDEGKCLICEAGEEKADGASNDHNKLLIKVTYPHKFYDKFQRSRKKTHINVSRAFPTKESMNLTKPQKLATKAGRAEKTTNVYTTKSDETNNTNVNPNSSIAREPCRLWDSSNFETFPYQSSKAKKSPDSSGSNKKEVHVGCKIQNSKTVVITEGEERSQVVLHGLKGAKKDTTICKFKDPKHIKKSLYKVNSLGIKFSIPEYNDTLHERVLSDIPRPTTMSYVQNSDTQLPRSPSKLGATPFREATRLGPRDLSIGNVPKLERSYTLPSKLFSDRMFDAVSRTSVQDNNNRTKIKASSSVMPLSRFKPHTRYSLPPLGFDLKARSITLSHF